MSEEELKAFRNLNTFSTKYIVNKKASSENDIVTMFVYIAKLEVKLEHKDKEIERLNKKIEQYENPEDMTLMFMWCDEKAKDKIKRLNNIINELEEYMIGKDIYKILLYKLRDLKGSDKE